MPNSSKNNIRDRMKSKKDQSVFSMVAGNEDLTSENNNEEEIKNNSDLNNEKTNVINSEKAIDKNIEKNSKYGSIKSDDYSAVEDYGDNGLDMSKLDMKKIKKIGKKNKRERFEETHKKATFWVKKELLEAFNNAVDHGLKSEKINEAIYDWLIKEQNKNEK